MPTQCSLAFVGTSDWTSGCVADAGKPGSVIAKRGFRICRRRRIGDTHSPVRPITNKLITGFFRDFNFDRPDYRKVDVQYRCSRMAKTVSEANLKAVTHFWKGKGITAPDRPRTSANHLSNAKPFYTEYRMFTNRSFC